MILVHMLDGALLGVKQRAGIRNLSQELLGLEIYDPPETRDQMSRMRPDPKKKEKEIPKIYKGFRGRMGVEVAPAQTSATSSPLASSARPASMIRDPSSGSPFSALVQHQRDPGIGQECSGWCSARREISRNR